MALDFAATYKVLVLGDSNVGKTCIVHRYCDERYYDTYISTIGIDFKQKIINLDGTPIKLQIWDTAGQERFRTLTTAYYRGAMGILLMYDVTSMESFNHLSYWLRNIQENASPDVVKVLAANKCDATTHRAVDAIRGNKIAENFDMPFFEVSCKENINIEEAFLTLARRIREQRGRRGPLSIGKSGYKSTLRSSEFRRRDVSRVVTKEQRGCSESTCILICLQLRVPMGADHGSKAVCKSEHGTRNNGRNCTPEGLYFGPETPLYRFSTESGIQRSDTPC